MRDGNPSISVIIPVYNVEKYLEKCILSVMNQSFRDLEIILVDDGSSDSSGDICDNYAKKDTRIKVIHKENGGLSDARNTGTSQATGKYLIYIDSDDYIDTDMLKILYEDITKNDVDMAVCGIYDVYEGVKRSQCSEKEQFVCSYIEAFRLMLIGQKIKVSICNSLLKREILSSVRFVVGKHYEDVYFRTDLLPLIKKVSINTMSLYYYIHRSASITTGKFNKSSWDIIKAYERNLKVVEKNYPELRDVAEFRIQWAYFVVMDRMMDNKHYWEIPGYQKVRKTLKKKAFSIIRSQYFHKTRRIAAVALFINVKLYYLLLRLQKKYNDKLI